jgi:hypothetical protein
MHRRLDDGRTGPRRWGTSPGNAHDGGGPLGDSHRCSFPSVLGRAHRDLWGRDRGLGRCGLAGRLKKARDLVAGRLDRCCPLQETLEPATRHPQALHDVRPRVASRPCGCVELVLEPLVCPVGPPVVTFARRRACGPRGGREPAVELSIS